MGVRMLSFKHNSLRRKHRQTLGKAQGRAQCISNMQGNEQLETTPNIYNWPNALSGGWRSTIAQTPLWNKSLIVGKCEYKD